MFTTTTGRPMSIERLRRILQRPLSVDVVSTAHMAADVNAAAQARQHLNPKTAAAYGPLLGTHPLTFRAIDFLRKIGELTTPKQVNLARLSASWATRRYFWAINDPGPNQQGPMAFFLSADARDMERHQKTLLSDEFGMGFAGLVAERLLLVEDFVDVQFALSNPTQYFGAHPVADRRPDFLMWGPNTPIFIIECKGSQTRPDAVVQQLRRGLEQLPAIEISNLATTSLVVATHLDGQQTRVFVLDPPNDKSRRDRRKSRKKVDRTLDKTGDREFEVADLAAFRDKLLAGADLTRLRWAGQHEVAARIEVELGAPERDEHIPNAPLDRLESDAGEFLGTATPFTPELGPSGPRLFRGVRADVLARLDVHGVGQHADAMNADDFRLSIGPLGTCLAILDLPV